MCFPLLQEPDEGFDGEQLLAALNSQDTNEAQTVRHFLTLLAVCHTVVPQAKPVRLNASLFFFSFLFSFFKCDLLTTSPSGAAGRDRGVHGVVPGRGRPRLRGAVDELCLPRMCERTRS